MKRQFIPWNDETMPLSKSGVHMFGQCPWRFNQQFRLGVEARTPEMDKGREVHNQLEEIYTLIDKNYIRYTRDLDILWEEYTAHLPDTTIMRNFLEIEMDRFKELERKGKLKMFFPKFTEEYMVDEELMFYGTVDRVDQLETGNYVVIDYKSGKFHKWLLSNYRFEMMGYKHLVEATGLVENVSSMAVLCLGDVDPKKRILFQEFHYATINAFYAKINRTRSRIRECILADFWPKKEQMCDWCPNSVSVKCKMESAEEQVK